jgi:MFS-type transporter involved in bile tolerance (Atg22 family)
MCWRSPALRWSRRLRNVALTLADLEWILAPPPPGLAAAIPWLGFSNNTPLAVTGVLLWGAAMGIQESTMRAAVAELAPAGRRGSAYGIFTACYGIAWLAGSVLIGVLYEQSVFALAVVLTVIQAAALAIFIAVRPHKAGSPASVRPR